jgi:hypothetical protein
VTSLAFGLSCWADVSSAACFGQRGGASNGCRLCLLDMQGRQHDSRGHHPSKNQPRRMKMKVSFEMEDEQVDAIVVQVLEDHILYTYNDFVFLQSDDVEWNNKLREALWVIFDYFASEEKVKELKNLIEGGEDEV